MIQHDRFRVEWLWICTHKWNGIILLFSGESEIEMLNERRTLSEWLQLTLCVIEYIHFTWANKTWASDKRCVFFSLSLSPINFISAVSKKTTCWISMLIMHISHSHRLPHLEFHLFKLYSKMCQSAHSQLRISHIRECVSVVSESLGSFSWVLETITQIECSPPIEIHRIVFRGNDSLQSYEITLFFYMNVIEIVINHVSTFIWTWAFFCASLIFHWCIFASKICLDLCSTTKNWQFMSPKRIYKYGTHEC